MPHSPFADLRAGPQSNPERTQYVPPQVIQAVLAACPNHDWRGIVALSRYAGLRCPSEVLALRWGDVNWERGRLTVRSQKRQPGMRAPRSAWFLSRRRASKGGNKSGNTSASKHSHGVRGLRASVRAELRALHR